MTTRSCSIRNISNHCLITTLTAEDQLQCWHNKPAPVAHAQAIPKDATKPQVFVTMIHQTGKFQLDKKIQYIAPTELVWKATDHIATLRTHSLLTTHDCPICLDPLKVHEAGQLTKCRHQFHYSCIRAALAHSSQCPLCKANIVEPQGKMPSGEMIIRDKPTLFCKGYASDGTIEIQYSIPSGVQKSYHT
jgi:hypothetical protein